MRLAVISHKVCWKIENAQQEYHTDGGFPLQIKAISELFDSTRLLVPCEQVKLKSGLTPLSGKKLEVVPLTLPRSTGVFRKLLFPIWFLQNSVIILREIKNADAVHAPIPGDVGTIGMMFAMMLKKPLFVRHCGNWLVQRTTAERFWKWAMEHFGGGRNAMFATGGTDHAPSDRNPAVKWIFSTSLTKHDMHTLVKPQFPKDGKLKLITACRLENKKGVDVCIASMVSILERFPNATLGIVGDGAQLPSLRQQVEELSLSEKITFYGKVKHSEVIKLMKQSHVFCFPTTSSEGFPKVVIEALACGLPVVTTKVSTLPHLIGQGGGVLLDAATSERLSKAVISIFDDAEKYNHMSASAKSTAEEYTLENWQKFIDENLRQSWKVASLTSQS